MASFKKDGFDLIMRLDSLEAWNPAFPRILVDKGYSDVTVVNVYACIPQEIYSKVRMEFITNGFRTAGSYDQCMLFVRTLRSSGDGECTGPLSKTFELPNMNPYPGYSPEMYKYGIETGQISRPAPKLTAEQVEARHRQIVHADEARVIDEARIIDDRPPVSDREFEAPVDSPEFDYKAGLSAASQLNQDHVERLAEIRRQQEAIADRLQKRREDAGATATVPRLPSDGR